MSQIHPTPKSMLSPIESTASLQRKHTATSEPFWKAAGTGAGIKKWAFRDLRDTLTCGRTPWNILFPIAMYQAVNSTPCTDPRTHIHVHTSTHMYARTHTQMQAGRVTNLPHFPAVRDFLGHRLSELKPAQPQANQDELVSLHTGKHTEAPAYRTHTPSAQLLTGLRVWWV